MDLTSVTSITISIALVWMFFQLAWFGSRILDRKMLKNEEAPPEHIRKEQRSVFFSFVILGTGTLAFSYVVGIASSWSAEEILRIGSAEPLQRPLGITGSVLFSGSLFLYAVFAMILFVAHFRKKTLTFAEIIADTKAFDSRVGGTSQSARAERLEQEFVASRARFREGWRSNAADLTFYRLFVGSSSEAPRARIGHYRFAASWQWKRTTWRPFAVGHTLLALSVLAEMIGLFPRYGPNVLLLLAPALLLVWLQISCAYAELRFLAVDLRLELRRYKSAKASVALFRSEPTAVVDPTHTPSAGAKTLLLAIGPLQLWK